MIIWSEPITENWTDGCGKERKTPEEGKGLPPSPRTLEQRDRDRQTEGYTLIGEVKKKVLGTRD